MKQFSISTSTSKLTFPRVVKLLLLILTMVIFSRNAYATQVVLTWTQLNDPVTGYKLYYGPTPGNYTQSVDVGNVSTYTLDLPSGSTYYIAATDHDAAGNESAFSNELIAMVPAVQQYTLSVGKAGTGTGSVSGAGIDCGAVCSGSYAAGTDVILTATAATGSIFSGWSGGGGSGTGAYETVVNAATSVTATFTKVYSITATSDINGAIIPSGTPPVNQATNGSSIIKIVTVNPGANQSFTITPNTGYHLADLKADGTSVGAAGTYTFSNVATDHTLNATFAINNISYTLTASAGTGGGISPSGATTVNSGASQAYTITPTTGYHIVGVSVDGASVGAVSTYTFSNVTAGHTIAATFAVNTYTISASSGTGGSISPSGSTTVNSGASQTYTITPTTGYHIVGVSVDGASAGAVSTYTFSNVTAGHTIAATFAVNTYSVSASSGTGGSISPTGTSTVNSGSSLTYTITPTAGYQIAGVTVDGVSVGAVSTYSFSNISAGHTISASFAVTSSSYTLSAVSSRGGSISPRGSTTVKSGGSQTYTFSPNSGYHVADVKVDGVSAGAVTSYTFTTITANHTIAATFTNKSYSITASSGTGGSISPSGATTVYAGASQSFTVTPSVGYQIAGVTVDGVSVGAVSTYTFSNVTAGHTIAATFSAKTYTISASSGTGGSISPTGTTTVNSGASQTYTITPTTGYQIAGVTVDGVSVGVISSYTFSNVTAGHTIAATFSVKTYTISASSGTGGSISPTGTATVNSGASQIYTITPTTGYQIAGVTVDGISLGVISSYIFSNVTANHTIQASFALSSVSSNIASLATVTASSQSTSTGQLAIKAVDGIISGYPNNNTAEWATNGQLAGAWINLSWTRSYIVDKIVLFDRPNLSDNVLSGTLTFSDGSSITVGQLANDGTGNTISFAAKTVNWVKFTITGANGSNIGLSEFQVFGY